MRAGVPSVVFEKREGGSARPPFFFPFLVFARFPKGWIGAPDAPECLVSYAFMAN